MLQWIEWWHWVVLGLFLITAEMFIFSFFVIWFGLSAALVGVLLLLIPPLMLPIQIVLWACFSGLFAFLWLRYCKTKTVTHIGSSSAQVIGEVGVLVSALSPETRGKVRFQKPVLGADIWDCYAELSIAAGERVRIVAIEGSFMKVEAIAC